MSQESIRSYFVIWGTECNPDEITRETGITPTKMWRTGDLRYAKTGKHHADSGWRIDAPDIVEPTLNAHLERLLDLLWHARSYLQTLETLCQLQATVIIHCNGTPPPMDVTAANIDRLASLGASIDIDLYC